MERIMSAMLHQARNVDATQIYVAVFVLLVVYMVTVAVKRRHFPPGPWGWPIVGYLPYVSQDAHLDFIELGKKYGPVFSVKMGSQTIVILHSPEAIKEALTKSEFLGRPVDGALQLVLSGSAFFAQDIDTWREHRRFVVHSMKDLGLGKSLIEGEIMNEIHHFLDAVSASKGQPMDPSEPLSPSMSNNICSLVFGKRYDYEDADRVLLDTNLQRAVDSFSHTTFAGFFPWLLRMPFAAKVFKLEAGHSALNVVKNFLGTLIKKHKDTFDPKNVRDFIDSFIVEMNARKKKDPNTTLTDESLAYDVMDLFTAGSDTVRTTLLWVVYVAAAHPGLQDMLRAEVLDLLGPDRDPEIMDLKNAPRTHSFILEVMRWKTIVPLGVPRSTVSDVQLCGYTIPKNTTVLFNLWHAHNSPKHWAEPDKFIPERFIANDGKTVSRPPYFMPFALGKRGCPGETMAIMEMFLYFTSLIRKFTVMFPDGYVPTYEATLQAIYKLTPFEIRFVERN